MTWKILYRNRWIVGENGCDTCVVQWDTPEFSWETWHKNIRSAQIAITKAEKAEQQTNKEQQ